MGIFFTFKINQKMKYWIIKKWWQIKNIFLWLPILWKQRDWDYRFATEVFIFQLRKTADFLLTDYSYSAGNIGRASCIRRWCNLAEKTLNESFDSEYRDFMQELYGDWGVDWKHQEDMNVIVITTMYDGKPAEKEQQMVEKFLSTESFAKQEKANKLIWKLLADHIQDWWD